MASVVESVVLPCSIDKDVLDAKVNARVNLFLLFVKLHLREYMLNKWPENSNVLCCSDGEEETDAEYTTADIPDWIRKETGDNFTKFWLADWREMAAHAASEKKMNTAASDYLDNHLDESENSFISLTYSIMVLRALLEKRNYPLARKVQQEIETNMTTFAAHYRTFCFEFYSK